MSREWSFFGDWLRGWQPHWTTIAAVDIGIIEPADAWLDAMNDQLLEIQALPEYQP